MMKFHLGRLTITPAALMGLEVDAICRAIDRHVCGDWGDLSEPARRANENALIANAPLLSVYRLSGETELRVLTTGDRLTTTIYLPGDSVTGEK